jgi:hypothetical protein
METFFQKKIGLLVTKSGLGQEERDFLLKFSENASSVRLGRIYASVLRSDDRDDYFLSLVYGVRLRRHLDAVEYLSDSDRGAMIGLITGMSGKDMKRLYETVISGADSGEKSTVTLVGDIRDDLNHILDVTQTAFADLIRKRSEERDHLTMRKIREKLGIGE